MAPELMLPLRLLSQPMPTSTLHRRSITDGWAWAAGTTLIHAASAATTKHTLAVHRSDLLFTSMSRPQGHPDNGAPSAF